MSFITPGLIRHRYSKTGLFFPTIFCAIQSLKYLRYWKSLDYVKIFKYLRQTVIRSQRFDSETLNDVNRTSLSRNFNQVSYLSILKIVPNPNGIEPVKDYLEPKRLNLLNTTCSCMISCVGEH